MVPTFARLLHAGKREAAEALWAAEVDRIASEEAVRMPRELDALAVAGTA